MATYLNRTPSSASNRKTWTYSTWLKRSQLSAGNAFLAAGAGTVEFTAYFVNNNTLEVYQYDSGTYRFRYITNQVFRDTSAWYHIVIACDTTQGSASDRVKIYVNGSQITSFSTNTTPSQNQDTSVNLNTPHVLGRYHTSASGYYLGYMAQTILVDGTALTPSTFGSTNTNGIWVPNPGPSVTYGTNGFKLDFAGTGTTADASGFGADSSGNGNHFTANSLGTNPSTTDTTQNNFATLTSMGFPQGTRNVLTQGNLDFDFTGDGAQSGQRLDNQCISNIGLTKGKWYAEFKITEDVNGGFGGITNWSNKQNTQNIESFAYIYTGDGEFYYKEKTGAATSTSSYGAGLSLNDVMMVALDMDNKNVYFGNNGQWGSGGGAWNQANPTAAKSFSSDFINTDSYGVVVFNVASAGANETPRWLANFGNPIFTIASGNADANGYGNFEYAVPSGYYALCTKNLALYGG